MTRSQQFRDGFRRASKAAVTIAHEEAARMNDPHARGILDTVALTLGAGLKRRLQEMGRPNAGSPEPERCSLCTTPLDVPGRPWTQNCGGDCLACMAEAGDPDCAAALPRHTDGDVARAHTEAAAADHAAEVARLKEERATATKLANYHQTRANSMRENIATLRHRVGAERKAAEAFAAERLVRIGVLEAALREAAKTIQDATLHVRDDLIKDILQRAAVRFDVAALAAEKGADRG